MNNRGNVLSNFGQLATGIAAVAIILTVAFLILAEGKDQSSKLAASFTETNRTQAITVDTFTQFSSACETENAATSTEVYNGTQGNGSKDGTGLDGAIVRLNAGNYTFSSGSINVSNDNLGGGVAGVGASVNFTWSCTVKDHAYNATSTMQSATNDIPDWVPLIVIAAIGATLLAMVRRFRS